MNRLVPLAVIVSIVLVMGTANALTTQVVDYKAGTVISDGSAFASWDVGNLNEDGTPYWDNKSSDGPQKNVGYQLTGYGTMGSPPGALHYLAVTDASGQPVPAQAVPNWYFQDHSTFATLRFELAGKSNVNEFGLYEVDRSGNPVPGSEVVVFAGPDTPVKTVTTPITWHAFGVYLKSGSTYYYSQSSKNPAGDETYQHFALFKQSPGTWSAARWWIGIEDLPYASNPNEGNPNNDNRGDYNDMIISMEAIPDASTWMLFLSGVPALALLRRKRA